MKEECDAEKNLNPKYTKSRLLETITLHEKWMAKWWLSQKGSLEITRVINNSRFHTLFIGENHQNDKEDIHVCILTTTRITQIKKT